MEIIFLLACLFVCIGFIAAWEFRQNKSAERKYHLTVKEIHQRAAERDALTHIAIDIYRHLKRKSDFSRSKRYREFAEQIPDATPEEAALLRSFELTGGIEHLLPMSGDKRPVFSWWMNEYKKREEFDFEALRSLDFKDPLNRPTLPPVMPNEHF